MTQLWPWRNYIGHLVGHEGAGSLQSFLKRQGRGDLHVVMGNGVSCPKTRARAQIMERDLQGKHCETFSLNLGRPYDHWHLSDMSHIFFLGCLGKATVKRQKGSGPDRPGCGGGSWSWGGWGFQLQPLAPWQRSQLENFESAYQLSDITIIIIPTDFMNFYELSSSLLWINPHHHSYHDDPWWLLSSLSLLLSMSLLLLLQSWLVYHWLFILTIIIILLFTIVTAILTVTIDCYHYTIVADSW